MKNLKVGQTVVAKRIVYGSKIVNNLPVKIVELHTEHARVVDFEGEHKDVFIDDIEDDTNIDTEVDIKYTNSTYIHDHRKAFGNYFNK